MDGAAHSWAGSVSLEGLSTFQHAGKVPLGMSGASTTGARFAGRYCMCNRGYRVGQVSSGWARMTWAIFKVLLRVHKLVSEGNLFARSFPMGHRFYYDWLFIGLFLTNLVCFCHTDTSGWTRRFVAQPLQFLQCVRFLFQLCLCCIPVSDVLKLLE